MKLTIDRENWWRGEVLCVLRASDGGKMCCLGFFGLACGVTDEQMRELATIASDSEKWPNWLREAAYRNLLMDASDFMGMPKDMREAVMAAEFAKHGVEVEFV